GGAGGQVDFGIASVLSKGGCSIAVLRSTASKGTVSRIVSSFEPGTIVSLPWTFVDYVVTEYGIAKLLGKSRRQRAEELIAIAHPDFRGELATQAQRLF
ncbi:MAG: acetyl-CoA hydrolase/transferase C-terminal domain-containing protein, partial [Planctomycetota bacterium]